jgi:nicotinamidase-related amidase
MDGKFALLVIDVQQGLFTRSTPVYRAEELLENINSLVKRAHGSGAPVFYIQHSEPGILIKGSLDWQLHPQLHPWNSDNILHKLHDNAFEETDLDDRLQSYKVTTLVVTGLLTHCCVKATCLGGRRQGYQVILVQDGHSSYSRQAARIIDKWNQKLGEKQVEVIPAAAIKFDNG